MQVVQNTFLQMYVAYRENLSRLCRCFGLVRALLICERDFFYWICWFSHVYSFSFFYAHILHVYTHVRMHTVPTFLHASPSFPSSTPLSLQQYAAHSNRRRRRGDFYGVHAHLSNGFLLFVFKWVSYCLCSNVICVQMKPQISNILFHLEYEFIVVYSLLIWIIVLCSLVIWNTHILVDVSSYN